MTLQPILDFVARHLLTQNQQARIPGNSCQYRTHDGLSCAVGCLMRNYDPFLEGATILNKEFRLKFNTALGHTLTDDEIKILSSLQNIHDRCDPTTWEHHLRELAIRYQLQSFSRCDLESGRGREHPFPLWITTQARGAMDPLS